MFVCWLFRQFSCTEQSFLLTDHTCTVWWALSFWSLFLQARNSHPVHLSVITSGDPDAGRTPMCTPFTRRICPEKILNFSRGTWCANKRGCHSLGVRGGKSLQGFRDTGAHPKLLSQSALCSLEALRRNVAHSPGLSVVPDPEHCLIQMRMLYKQCLVWKQACF